MFILKNKPFIPSRHEEVKLLKISPIFIDIKRKEFFKFIHKRRKLGVKEVSKQEKTSENGDVHVCTRLSILNEVLCPQTRDRKPVPESF